MAPASTASSASPIPGGLNLGTSPRVPQTSAAAMIAVTVMNATVPRPLGPSSRAIGTTATSSPALPTTCAQNSGADPLAIVSPSSACTGIGDQLHEDPP